MQLKKVLVIVGSTASGKSALAIRLAKKFNGEIISADSRQVYKGLDIGTGKVTKKEMHGIPHHMLDVADPKKQFSASEYKNLADPTLRHIAVRDKLPIVVGGTGFYIDTLTNTVTLTDVGPNQTLRKNLGKKNAKELFKILQKKDPRRAKSIDQYNKVRLIRALEIVEALGHVPKCQPATSTPYRFVYIGLKPAKKDLDEKIYQRFVARIPGIIRESKKLHNKGLTYKRMHELGLEYRYIAMYLQSKITKEEMVMRLNIKIRQYAKRQMTWFKRNKKIRWFTPEEYKKIEKYLKKFLTNFTTPTSIKAKSL